MQKQNKTKQKSSGHVEKRSSPSSLVYLAHSPIGGLGSSDAAEDPDGCLWTCEGSTPPWDVMLSGDATEHSPRQSTSHQVFLPCPQENVFLVRSLVQRNVISILCLYKNFPKKRGRKSLLDYTPLCSAQGGQGDDSSWALCLAGRCWEAGF